MRASIRETLDGDLSRGNQTARHGEAPMDRVMALVHTRCPAGIAVKRLRANRQPNDLRVAIMALDEALLRGRDRTWIEQINSIDRLILIHMALDEWNNQRCTTCNGRRSLHAPGMDRIDCIACGASGLRRYSDGDRAQRFGGDLTAMHKQLLEVVAAEIAHYDMVSDEATKTVLGRR